MSTVRPTKLSR